MYIHAKWRNDPSFHNLLIIYRSDIATSYKILLANNFNVMCAAIIILMILTSLKETNTHTDSFGHSLNCLFIYFNIILKVCLGLAFYKHHP